MVRPNLLLDIHPAGEVKGRCSHVDREVKAEARLPVGHDSPGSEHHSAIRSMHSWHFHRSFGGIQLLLWFDRSGILENQNMQMVSSLNLGKV
jgi:hypothetical protein